MALKGVMVLVGGRSLSRLLISHIRYLSQAILDKKHPFSRKYSVKNFTMSILFR